MIDVDPSARHRRAALALLPLFFLSGLTGLIYQTLWARQLHLVFGTSMFAIATVLSAFMGGLAIGGFAMGRIADRVNRPLRVYGLLEIGIGVYAAAYPVLVGRVTPIYLSIHADLQPTPVGFGVLQLVLIGATLLLPTALMGATLPLLARFATRRLGEAGDRVASLYAVNTAGAVAGTALCGFVLLPAFGLSATTYAAAICNVVLGVAALGLARWAGEGPARPVVEDGPAPPLVDLVAVSIAMGFAGFASLAYEITWTRVLGLILGASVYAFSTMLLAFLVGIAVGGRIGGPLADLLYRRWGRVGVVRGLALTQVLVGVMSYLLMHTFVELPLVYLRLFEQLGVSDEPRASWALSLLIAGLVMTPPALWMGASFPLAVRAVVVRPSALGGPVGIVQGANTAGAVLGASMAAFVLMPVLSIAGTVVAAVAMNLAAAVVLLSQVGTGERGWRRAIGPVSAVAILVGGMYLRPTWDRKMMTAGLYYRPEVWTEDAPEVVRAYFHAVENLYYAEGLSSVVTVDRYRDGSLALSNNGKPDASTTDDMVTQVLLGLLPFQYASDPRDVLVIGLASGVTAGSVTLVDSVERLDVIELEAVMPGATKLFEDYNNHVLDDPRLHIVHNDGRNQILLTPAASYDVIISEPPNPWITGVSNLFTAEFFAAGRTRLRPNGVWCQWMHLYAMDVDDFRSILATFADTYPYAMLWQLDADVVFLGSNEPFEADWPSAAALFEDPAIEAELARVGVLSEYQLLTMYRLDRDGIVRLTDGVERNTDDNMRVEYSAPLNLGQDTWPANDELLLASAQVPPVQEPDALMELAYAYSALSAWERAEQAMDRALSMLAADDARRPDFESARRTWAAQKEMEGNLERANGCFEPHHAQDPNVDPRVVLTLHVEQGVVQTASLLSGDSLVGACLVDMVVGWSVADDDGDIRYTLDFSD
jgi:spermidine synthase